MFAIVMIIASIYATDLLDSGIAQGLRVMQSLKGDARKSILLQLAREIERYRALTGVYPASLATLYSQAGFEHTRSLSVAGLGYQLSGNISDGTWLFNRAVVAAIDSLHTDLATFWGLNTCSTGNAATAADWCGVADTAYWYRGETRQYFIRNALTARRRMNGTLAKIIGYWNVNQAFPSGALSAGGNTTVAALVNYNGTAANCSGTFSFSGIPFDCDDMFTPWGSAVEYNYISQNYISLVAITPNVFSSGGYQTVAAEMHY